jgi:hypothetical protein
MNIKINRSIAVLSLLLLLTIFFTWGFERLCEQKQYYLDKIMKLDKPCKSYLSAAIGSITKPTAGFVKGIVYSNTKSSAVIKGKNDILHEENTVYGATIVRIYKDKVEFAKNGRQWTQKVGEIPGSEWYN